MNNLSTKKVRLIRTVFGVALFGSLILYFDPQQVASSLASLNLRWVAAAAVLIVCSGLIGAVNTFLFVNLENKLTFTVFLPLFWLSWGVGLIFPGQVGDLASLATLLRRHGINFSTSLGRSFADKLISFALTTACAAWGIGNLSPPAIFWEWLAIFLMLFGLAAWKRKFVFSFFGTRFTAISEFVSGALVETLHVLLSHSGRTAANILLSALKIALSGLSYWLVFLAMGYHGINPWQVIPLVAISSLTAYIPISLNGLGTAETAGVVLFSSLGVTEVDVLSAYLVLRVMIMLITWLPAGLWLLTRPYARDA